MNPDSSSQAPASLGQGRVTLATVAREAGVAVSTASAILRGETTSWASKQTRQRVFAAAEQVGYRPNQIARSLRAKASNLIGLAFNSLQMHPTSIAKFAEVERHALEAGYQVLIRNHHGSSADEIKQHLADYLSYQVAGIIFMPGHDPEAQLKWLEAAGIPTVTMDATDASHGPNVTVDRPHGAYLQVRHMMQDVGCRRLAFLMPGRARSASDPTYQKMVGFGRALADCGSSEQEHLFRPGEEGRDHGFAFGRQSIAELISSGERFDGVVTTSDSVALSALHMLEHAGLRVPQDVAVVGFDDQPFAAHLAVPLTTVRQPSGVGRIAVNMLLDQIRQANNDTEPDNRVLKPELIVRASTVLDPAATAST